MKHTHTHMNTHASENASLSSSVRGQVEESTARTDIARALRFGLSRLYTTGERGREGSDVEHDA